MIFMLYYYTFLVNPFKEERYTEFWDYTKEWFSNCKHMTRKHFKTIRAALCWTDNET